MAPSVPRGNVILPFALCALASSAGGYSAHGPRSSEAAGRLAFDADEHEPLFAAFVQDHGRTYEAGSAEYAQRLALFKERMAAIAAHNGQPGRLWSAGVNALADRTPEELQRLRGYRHGVRPEGGGAARAAAVGLVGTSAEVHRMDVDKLPKDFTWATTLQSMKDVRDQEGCGSCWAVASATVLRAHAELYQRDRTFSVQQLISCTPNPRSCGGDGGCKGATAELAFDYVAKVGLVTEDALAYTAADGGCPAGMEVPAPRRSALRQVALPELSIEESGGAAFGMVGWRKLPENKLEPLLLAVYESGPVVVSVAAADPWNFYKSGVMNACSKDAVVNHAVALVGYGEDSGNKYWQIQNSWGPKWGEGGFARLLRLDHKEEGDYCGWDASPEQGTGCKGGPSKVLVCGNCGILYDSVVPKFRLSEDGWWARLGNRRGSSEDAFNATA